jgi:signal transduction histidine kinase
MVSGLRGYLITKEDFFIETYDSAILENEKILRELSSIFPKTSDQKILLDEISDLHKYWVTEFAAPLLEAKQESLASDSSEMAFNKLYKVKLAGSLEKDVQRSLQKKFSEFTNAEYTFRNSRKQALNESVRKTKSVSFLLTGVSVVAGICIAMFIAHYISSRILKMLRMANSISAGDYQVRIQESGNSELSQLAKALNNMASVLHQNISLLKRQRDELDQFAHIVSHDIKAPLRGIDNVVTWIEEDHSFDLPPKVNEYLELIKGRIIRAENLVKGLLAYAKIGKEAYGRELVDLNDLLNEALEGVPKRAGIDVRIQSGLPIFRTEKVPLLQVFTNLITNAIKYNDKEKGSIKVYHKPLENFYEFYVEDNGPGIQKNYHEKIFMIFQTLNERDKIESTGVGLAIVRKILDDRNLAITVESKDGLGSKFMFTWPKN